MTLIREANGDGQHLYSDELLMSEVIRSEALINLLGKKGIIIKQEFLPFGKPCT